ncbi:hypothetical protein HW132_26880 [Brasilonema sp. CT11]|nr:hypothetical protein [Brasilonema sp. CT11]
MPLRTSCVLCPNRQGGCYKWDIDGNQALHQAECSASSLCPGVCKLLGRSSGSYQWLVAG